MSEIKRVDPRTLRPGPIRHESLPPELLEQVKAIFDVIGPFIKMTLEEFEVGFMRDMHPGSEIALWGRITAAWLAYHDKYLDNKTLAKQEEGRLLGVLIAISTGVRDAKSLGVPSEVAERLVESFDESRG